MNFKYKDYVYVTSKEEPLVQFLRCRCGHRHYGFHRSDTGEYTCQVCGTVFPANAVRATRSREVRQNIRRSDEKLTWYKSETFYDYARSKDRILLVRQVTGCTCTPRAIYYWRKIYVNGKPARRFPQLMPPYFKDASYHPVSDWWPNLLRHLSDEVVSFYGVSPGGITAVAGAIGEVIFARRHPLLASLGVTASSWMSIPRLQRNRISRAKTPRELVRLLTGRASKAVMRTVLSRGFHNIDPGSLYLVARMLPDTNHLLTVLASVQAPSAMVGVMQPLYNHARYERMSRAYVKEARSLQKVLLAHCGTRALSFAASCLAERFVPMNQYLYDTLRQFDGLCEANTLTIREILPPRELPLTLRNVHDHFSYMYRMLHDRRSREERERARQPFAYHPWVKNLERDFGALAFRLPVSEDELVQWGARLHNCVGSYAGRVRNDSSIIVGGFTGGELAYCIELRYSGPGSLGYELVQFKTSCNGRVSADDLLVPHIRLWLAECAIRWAPELPPVCNPQAPADTLFDRGSSTATGVPFALLAGGTSCA